MFCGALQMTLRHKIIWCRKQKNGVKLIEPNDNLSEAYLKKSNEALKVMKKIGGVSKEWSISSAYYARYNAVYSLLMKCGIESEIHDCTLAIFRFLFRQEFEEDVFEEVEAVKEQRINTQYYTDRNLNNKKYQAIVKDTPDFILKIESFIINLTKDQIEEIRKKLKKLIEK